MQYLEALLQQRNLKLFTEKSKQRVRLPMVFRQVEPIRHGPRGQGVAERTLSPCDQGYQRHTMTQLQYWTQAFREAEGSASQIGYPLATLVTFNQHLTAIIDPNGNEVMSALYLKCGALKLYVILGGKCTNGSINIVHIGFS